MKLTVSREWRVAAFQIAQITHSLTHSLTQIAIDKIRRQAVSKTDINMSLYDQLDNRRVLYSKYVEG